MKAKDFITRPDIMAIYEKEGVTTEVLNSITSVAGYQIALEENKENNENTNETPVEEQEPVIETPVEEQEPVIETPVEEPTVTEPEQTEPEILVEEDEEK
jgi:hypothetical protein